MFSWIWSEKFWLPPPYKWADMKSKEGMNIPEATDILIYPLLFALGLLFLRNVILIPFVFTPIGKRYGIRSKPYKHPPPNEELEKLYKVNRARPPMKMLERYAADIGWKERQVQRWLRQKALSWQMTTLDKFNDNFWQATYYASYWALGAFVVMPKPWYLDVKKCFENYPLQHVPNDIWWYYMIITGFYFAQTFLLLRQDRRHDFYQMLTHHICAYGILSFCWVTNTIRICCMSIFFHECSDAFLSAAKILFYCKSKWSDHMYIPFLITWSRTRLYQYPMYIVLPVIYVAPHVGGRVWPAAHVLQVYTVLLFILHLIWTKEIIVSIWNKWTAKCTKYTDPRSSGEEMSDDDIGSEMHAEQQSSACDKEEGVTKLAELVLENGKEHTVHRGSNGIRCLKLNNGVSHSFNQRLANGFENTIPNGMKKQLTTATTVYTTHHLGR